MSVVDGGDRQMHETPGHLRGGRGNLDWKAEAWRGAVWGSDRCSSWSGWGRSAGGTAQPVQSMRPHGKCRSLREHKVSWKVRLGSDKKVLRWSVPKRLSVIYRFKSSLKCVHDGGVGRARWSGLRVRAMATVERIPGSPAGSSTAPPGGAFCNGSQNPWAFPLSSG